MTEKLSGYQRYRQKHDLNRLGVATFYDVPCVACGAEVGRPCSQIANSGKWCNPHSGRITSHNEKAAGK